MPIQGPNCDNKSKVQLIIFLILHLILFKSFFVVMLVSGTNPHVEVAIAVLASVTGWLTLRQVIWIVKFIDIFRAMASHTDFGLVTNSVPFPYVHLNISRATRRIVMEMVIIKLFSITFFI